MPYIGNSVQNQGFAPAIDYFNGNGVTVTFTLSRPLASVAQIICAIDNVIQNPSSAFTVSGNSITFTSAPLSGTNNIWVEYTSLITTYAAISQDPSVIGDITASGGYLATGDFGNSYIDGVIVDYVTGAARITTGPLDNMIFYHGGSSSRSPMLDLYYAGGAKVYGGLIFTGALGVGSSPDYGTAGQLLTSQGSSAAPIWQSVSASSVDYLVVAGGGPGANVSGNSRGGGAGGGAGGMVTGTTAVSGTYTITVGAGGAAQANPSTTPSGGNASSIGSLITTVGGGAGGSNNYNSPSGLGYSGGSGGGGGGNGSSAAGGSGTSGQGNAGGTGDIASATYGGGGGGGGKGAVGGNQSGGTAGAGGAGAASSISGSSVTYAGGGGGGGTDNSTGNAGGSGGGGAGGNNGANGTSGTANRGGGGGAGGCAGGAAGSGGSGIVIISYSTGYRLATATGTYTQTTSGGNYIFTFTGSGTITF
jgi:hypothetical protein